MEKVYRNNGAIGALLDEYEKALKELIHVIHDVSNDQLITVIDKDTTDMDCTSIQTILTHVVQSGYAYVVEIRKWLGENVHYKEKVFFNSVKEYKDSLLVMFAYNEKLFTDHPDLSLIENNPDKKIHVPWGQKYDVEQLLEHAIVHVLRHRRQIDRFILKMNITA